MNAINNRLENLKSKIKELKKSGKSDKDILRIMKLNKESGLKLIKSV